MQTKPIIYNFNLNRNEPLDYRQTKVVDLNNLPPLPVRYSGLIIHVEEFNEPFIFLNDINNPVPLRSLASGNVLSVTSTNYRNLNNILNAVTTQPGAIITVFPMGTSFLRHETEWRYFSGTYDLNTTIEFEDIPDNLKGINARVFINGNQKVIKSNLELSDLIIIENGTPTVPENERYYLLNNILYYSIDNKLWKLGGSSIILNNMNLIKGDNNIIHDLNSTFIDVKIWININNKLTPIHSVNFIPDSLDKITLNSYIDINDVTILINTI